jgi:hypothetical protein
VRLEWNKDYAAGALIACIGAFAVLQGQSYRMGALTRVGSGFFPVLIGVLMILVGALIAGSASYGSVEAGPAPRPSDWRGRGCVIAGPVMFIIGGVYFGLAPATFACVFVAALGDRSATLRSAAVLAATITVVGVVLFSYILQVPFPILRWPHD